MHTERDDQSDPVQPIDRAEIQTAIRSILNLEIWNSQSDRGSESGVSVGASCKARDILGQTIFISPGNAFHVVPTGWALYLNLFMGQSRPWASASQRQKAHEELDLAKLPASPGSFQDFFRIIAPLEKSLKDVLLITLAALGWSLWLVLFRTMALLQKWAMLQKDEVKTRLQTFCAEWMAMTRSLNQIGCLPVEI
uniref:Uncharacterized protein n=1 Tax=Leersia perrieri TaxID=77586 RepID=A0A0D9VJ84_9ORYZ